MDNPRPFWLRRLPFPSPCLAVGALATVFVGVAPADGSQLPESPRPVDVVDATIVALQDAMERGRVTAVELVDRHLARIAAYDQRGPALNAMIRLNPNARAEAAALDRERAERGARGPLHGIPIILKDNYDTRDMPTSGGSIALAGLVPPDDAFQVAKLREAGAIILGKANMHELAAGITNISSVGGQTRNPYDLTRYPGGSSGGTGAAIAASFGVIGWGSDTCGSIRIPAALNNLFGLRPTKGLSSIDGIIPLSHTQDVGGPLARTATDLAIGLDATIGRDPADPATAVLAGRSLPAFVETLDPDALRGVRIGTLTTAFGDGPDDRAMGAVVRSALERMSEAGAFVTDLDIPALDTLLSGSSVISHEFKFDLMDYLAATPGAPVGSLQEILDLGLHHSQLESRFRLRNTPETRSTDAYREALAKQTALRAVVLETLERHDLDAIAYPTMRTKPARIGDPQRGSNCQLGASTGLPALSIPAGFTADGIPAGLELLGGPLSDARLVSYGHAFEQLHPTRRPPAATPSLTTTGAPEPVAFEIAATGGGAAVAVRFILDTTTGELTYAGGVSGVTAVRLHGVALHQRDSAAVGPVIHRLAAPGQLELNGRLTLLAGEREALLDGRLYLRVYTREQPLGTARVDLIVPER